jgi:magnesium-transporting ATPase (P-type)
MTNPSFDKTIGLGLTSTEAAIRLRHHGPNVLPVAAPVPMWRRIVDQFRSPIIYVLLVALAVDLTIWFAAMRETITFDHHAEHVWLHFTIRLFIVALLIFLFLVLTEGSFGQSLKQDLSQAEVWETERRLRKPGIDGIFDDGSKQALIAFQKIESPKRTGQPPASDNPALTPSSASSRLSN